MECAAAEQSVPLPATSQAAQRLLEWGLRLPKVAEANSGSCGGRGWTDSVLLLPTPGLLPGDLWVPCGHTQGARAALFCYGAEGSTPSRMYPCRVSACEGNWTSLCLSRT